MGDNTDLPSNSNISKTARVNSFYSNVYQIIFDKLSNGMQLIDFALVFLRLLMFKVCGIVGISKIEFLNFSGTKRVK